MYTFFIKELRNAFPIKKLFLILVLMILPIGYTLARQQEYILEDPLDLFTLILQGVFPLLFVLLASFVYLIHFAKELKNNFFFYEKIRIPVQKLIQIKFSAMFLSTFLLFLMFMLICFMFCFYIAPAFDLIDYKPNTSLIPGTLLSVDVYTKHTFTQLFQYGTVVYGLTYSIWVSLHAALFASLGFLLLLLISNSFVALSLPFLFYMIGAFLLPSIDPTLTPYWFVNSIFPYGYVQQEIWTAFIPFVILVLLSSVLYIYVQAQAKRLDDKS
ncbi:hypothetical protein [Saccharibacillus sp. JS10]|uniref:hypothetical protein n=1 Tax=Saccharibacillus sp. JS10 TaxID=2950552 RepID=UPI00210D6982|nr:hypothetical protein [Saccharibacillus sp. JS10]MCQ4087902.1 hypothetical protein [Saccharibacillus sp. JS10]